MSEDLYPRPLSLANYTAFQASHAYSLGDVVKPTTPNSHIYYVTTAGTSGSEPTWPTTSQGTVTSGSVVFTEHGTVPGVQYLKYLKVRPDYSEITIQSKYEDGGRDFNTSADTAPQRYEFDYDGLLDTDADVLDDFYDAHKIHLPFALVEPRDAPWTGVEGSTVSGVRFESYEKGHEKVKGTQKRSVKLVKYPT